PIPLRRQGEGRGDLIEERAVARGVFGSVGEGDDIRVFSMDRDVLGEGRVENTIRCLESEVVHHDSRIEVPNDRGLVLRRRDVELDLYLRSRELREDAGAHLGWERLL